MLRDVICKLERWSTFCLAHLVAIPTGRVYVSIYARFCLSCDLEIPKSILGWASNYRFAASLWDFEGRFSLNQTANLRGLLLLFGNPTPTGALRFTQVIWIFVRSCYDWYSALTWAFEGMCGHFIILLHILMTRSSLREGLMKHLAVGITLLRFLSCRGTGGVSASGGWLT